MCQIIDIWCQLHGSGVILTTGYTSIISTRYYLTIYTWSDEVHTQLDEPCIFKKCMTTDIIWWCSFNTQHIVISPGRDVNHIWHTNHAYTCTLVNVFLHSDRGESKVTSFSCDKSVSTLLMWTKVAQNTIIFNFRCESQLLIISNFSEVVQTLFIHS